MHVELCSPGTAELVGVLQFSVYQRTYSTRVPLYCGTTGRWMKELNGLRDSRVMSTRVEVAQLTPFELEFNLFPTSDKPVLSEGAECGHFVVVPCSFVRVLSLELEESNLLLSV